MSKIFSEPHPVSPQTAASEVSRVLFLGICLDFHYLLGRVGFPKL